MWQSISKNYRIIITASIVIAGILLFTWFRDTAQPLNSSEAGELLNTKPILSAVIQEPYVYIETVDKKYKILKDAVDLNLLFEKTHVEYDEESIPILELLMFMFIVGFAFYIMIVIDESRRREEMPGLEYQEEMGNHVPYQTVIPQLSGVRFSDVAGIDDVKEELEEIIDFLRYPDKYRNYDIRLPKGVLLVGPPGVGKTLIAKAVAGEADVPFFYQSAASFVQIYVGMGAKRVSELFNKAKQMAPSIVFIDEIDAVGKRRGGMNNDEREGTLNQLLTEMDGFEESSGVMVIAATNKIDVLDEALLRAGRFDRRVHISLPNFKERASTLELYLKDKYHNVDVDKIANMTIGFNSASLATLINEAAMYALRHEKEMIETEDVEAVKDKVLLGKHKIKTYNSREQKIQALYQAAKAVTATWLEVEYEKIGLLSSTFIPPNNEIISKTVLENQIKVLLAGRIATQKVYGELFSNAQEDIHAAKALTKQIIEEFVMADEYFTSPTYAETILQEATEQVKSLLSQFELAVAKVEGYLLENESITPKQTKKILDEIF